MFAWPELVKPKIVFWKYTWPVVTVKLFCIVAEEPTPVDCNEPAKIAAEFTCRPNVASSKNNVPDAL